jgi:ComF family protein
MFPVIPLTGDMPKPVARPFCERCGEPAPGAITGAYECVRCAQASPHFTTARSAYPFKGQVREAIHQFKYEGGFHHRRLLTQWLAEGFHAHFNAADWHALVPVPLHPRRRRRREFNQAEVLARGLAKITGIPVFTPLDRVKDTSSQTALSRPERLQNLKGAFAVKKNAAPLDDKNLLLIDDVMTTGATLDACARELIRAGADRVAALTVARD